MKRVLNYFICLNLILLLSACAIMDVESQLAKGVRESAQSNKLLVVKDYVSSDWDKMYVFPPYTMFEEVNQTLGFEWTTGDDFKTGIELYDNVNLIVFTKGNEVVDYVDFPIESGDFSPEEKLVLNRDEAVFKVEKFKSAFRLTPVKAKK